VADTQPALDRLRAWFADACDWPDAVLPDYEGGSVANVAPSIVRAFTMSSDAPMPALLPPLRPALLDPAHLAGARVIVLLVIDGYGAVARGRRLRSPAGPAPVAAGTMTSVFPSTTAAALTSMQTGAAAGQHGMAAYTLYVPGLRRVVNMVRFTAVDGAPLDTTALVSPAFLATPSIFDTLAALDVDAVIVSHRDYARSPLTTVQSGTTAYHGHRTLAELATLLLGAVARPGRRFVFGYWAGFDMLAHTWGPSSATCAIEAELVDLTLHEHVLNPLAARGDEVAVIVTADHGLMDIPPVLAMPQTSLHDVAGPWTRPATGERRALGLSLRDSAARGRLSRHIGDRGVVLDAREAIAAGLYGPQPRVPDLSERVGDTLVLARGGASFPYRPLGTEGDPGRGAHGSLTAEEMLVPLHVWRFGG
jgi:hypothetical protein